MKNWIETYTGKKATPLSPHPEQIYIEDIAHSLSLQCRFNGHCEKFYSVAEHSVHCANLADTFATNSMLPLFTLLHDASEAYLCDIPRPIKTQFPNYLQWEKQLSDIIFKKFTNKLPTNSEDILILKADNILLASEAACLTVSKGENWDLPETPSANIDIKCWPPKQAEHNFLKIFKKLTIRHSIH